MKNQKLIIGLIIVVVVIFGVSKIIRSNSGSEVSLGQGDIERTSVDEVGQASNLPDFTLSRLGGGAITLSDYRGERPVVLDFFATWCPNCRRDMPKLSKMYEKYGNEVEVIGVNLQEREQIVEDYISENNILFPIVFDPSASGSSIFGVQFTNTHVLIDKNGRVVSVIPGDIQESDIIGLIEASKS